MAVAVPAGSAARGEALGDEGQGRMNLTCRVHGRSVSLQRLVTDPFQVRTDPATWSRRRVLFRADGQDVGSKAALFAAVVERAAAEVKASLDDLAAGFGSASGLLSHVLTGGAHGRPGQATANPGARHASAEHTAAAYGVLFADAATLAAEPELTGPAHDAIRAIATHLTGLVQHARSAGSTSTDRAHAGAAGTAPRVRAR